MNIHAQKRSVVHSICCPSIRPQVAGLFFRGAWQWWPRVVCRLCPQKGFSACHMKWQSQGVGSNVISWIFMILETQYACNSAALICLSVVLLFNLLIVSVTCVPWHQMEVEQLLTLSGSALAQAVSSMLETPGLYVFSDILELPNVREVNASSFQTWHKEICLNHKNCGAFRRNTTTDYFQRLAVQCLLFTAAINARCPACHSSTCDSAELSSKCSSNQIVPERPPNVSQPHVEPYSEESVMHITSVQ